MVEKLILKNDGAVKISFEYRVLDTKATEIHSSLIVVTVKRYIAYFKIGGRE